LTICALFAYIQAVQPTLISFASAYRQLRPSEKVFVDAYVADIEREANRRNERISLALHRAIPANVIEASRGLLERPLVVAAISERITDLAAQSELTVHRMIKELMAVGFSSVGDYMNVGEDGMPWFDLTRCTPEQLSAIQSIEIEENPRTGSRKFKFKLHDKLGGMKMLADYMGLLSPDNQHWKADTARTVEQTAIPASLTTEQAGDRYSAMIND
jgi:hypothetical protein